MSKFEPEGESIEREAMEDFEHDLMESEFVVTPPVTVEVDAAFFAKLDKARAKLDRKKAKAAQPKPRAESATKMREEPNR